MSTEEARQKLREFYKLQPPPSPQPDKPQIEVTNEDNNLTPTTLEALDLPSSNAESFVQNLIENVGLVEFVKIADQVRREKLALASAQRELVNDNYRKLIQAAETLGYLSKQGDLAGLTDLRQPVNEFTEWFKNLPAVKN